MQNATQPPSNLEVALAVWQRRKWMALPVLVGVLSVAIPLAWSLPPVYESTATVLVEHPQESHSPAGPWAAADELETRLRTVSQQIMSRARLYELITQFDLYPQLRQRATPEALVERMRRDIQLQFTGVRAPSGLETTIAFNLSYRGRDPATVSQVTNALAALYVGENARMQEQRAAGTTRFLQAQLEGARRQLHDQEQRITAFKEQHIGDLPEQQVANLAAIERLNGQIRAIETRRDELTRLMTGGGPGASDTGSARLATLRQQLADLRTRYTDDHPAIMRVKQEIAALEHRLAASGGEPAVPSPAGPQPTTPRTPAEIELAALRTQEQILQNGIATYQKRIENAPIVEQELQQFSRDYTAAKDLYQSLLQRYQDAQLTERMDQRQADQFRILDPAVASRQPVGPHRFRLLLMGLMLSVGTAVVASVVADAHDTSFHTVDDVRAFTRIPVLASIPPIITAADARRHRRQFGLAALAATLGIAVVAGLSSHLAHSDALVGFLAQGHF